MTHLGQRLVQFSNCGYYYFCCDCHIDIATSTLTVTATWSQVPT